MSKVELLRISDLRIPETEVQSLFDDRLEAVEDGLRHVRSQVPIGVGVIDTIAVDDNNIPVIIEYKSKKAGADALVQVLDYYSWLNEHRDTLKELFRQGGIEIESVREPRIIIIAPEFDEKLIRIIDAVQPNITLVRYIVGEDEEGNKKIIPQVVLKSRGVPAIPPMGIDQHFKGKEELRPLYDRLMNRIKEYVPLNLKKDVRATRYYIGLYKKDRLFCSIEVQKRKKALRIALPLKGEIESDRFGGWPSDPKWGYVHVYSEEQIDDELLTWIKRAYEKVES